MKFKSLSITNFQSHKNTFIEFDKGITSIQGPSNNGKSAVIRALLWVITNKPNGDGFRNFDGGDTKVSLTLENGTVIERLKTNSKNCYFVNGTELQAFGQGVPEEVSKLLKMDDINIQQQLDPHFLLCETSGAIAKRLNDLVDLSDIDKSMSFIASEERDNNNKIKLYKENMVSLIRNLSNFNFLSEYESLVGHSELLFKRLNLIKEKQVKIQRILEKCEECQDKLKKYKNLEAKEHLLNKIFEQNEKMQSLTSKQVKLNVLIDKIKFCTNKISSFRNLEKRSMLCNSLEKTIKIHCELEAKQNKLNSIVIRVNDYKIKLTTLVNNLKTKQDIFEKEFPDHCPLCGSIHKKRSVIC